MVGTGYHIALGREHAKRVFSIRDDESLRQFLEELKSSKEMQTSGRLLETGVLWDPIHRCLTEGELDPAGGEFPLNHVVLGGKQLHNGADYVAALVRPDMTRFIADALAELEEDEVRKKFFALGSGSYAQPIDEKRFMELWLVIQDLIVFYSAAAENLEAVIFTAKYES